MFPYYFPIVFLCDDDKDEDDGGDDDDDDHDDDDDDHGDDDDDDASLNQARWVGQANPTSQCQAKPWGLDSL